MKKIFILLPILLVLSMIPFISAEIILDQQPKEVYSLGDIVSVPVTVKSSGETSGILQMDFLCGGFVSNFYKNGLSLVSGEEKKFESSLVLTRSVIGELKGTCKVKAFIGEEFILTNEFEVSDSITINPTIESLEFKPGENFLVKGQAFKENGKEVNGFIELSLVEENSSIISQLGTINKGFFSLNISLPKDMKAGAYLMKLNGYEEETPGEKTNTGFVDQNIVVRQVPKSLEVVFENSEVEPGTNVRVKAVLYDQTGEKIESSSFVTIKNNNNKIMEQLEIKTDEFFDFPILYNEPPLKWNVVAVSNKLTSNSEFKIMEKEDIFIHIANRTLTITNVGNVLYNRTALVKFGNESLNVDVFLDVDESQKYILSAPDGKYTVEVVADGETSVTETILTGNVIDIRKASGAVGSLVKYPIVWIFVIMVLGFAGFIVFKKGYQKSFVGYITSKLPGKKSNRKESVEFSPSQKKSLVNSRKKAEVSLSIKGDKQNVNVLALHIKNLSEIHSKDGINEEVIQGIVKSAEEQKAVTYENHGTIFFILAPARTRTFKNERTAINLAQKIKKILEEYNKSAKRKINFGISLNYGTIIAKEDSESFKFMSMGTLMTAAKRISSMANNDILLGEKINDRLKAEVKTTKHSKGNVHVYSIKEIKNVEENEKFVRSFLDRIEKDNKK